MRARDLAVENETVGVDTDAMNAARLMARHRLPALLVLDDTALEVAALMARVRSPWWRSWTVTRPARDSSA
ncbi:hypothetical protein GCM10027074_20460 [Streptomyces deserti]